MTTVRGEEVDTNKHDRIGTSSGSRKGGGKIRRNRVSFGIEKKGSYLAAN